MLGKSNIKYMAIATIGAAVGYLFRYIQELQKIPQKIVAHINPPTLPKAVGYCHIATVEMSDSYKTIYIAGQASLTQYDENVVYAPDNLEIQAKRAYENLGKALAAAGATPADVLKSDIYTTESRDSLATIIRERENFFRTAECPPPGALVGVKFLALEDLKIEVDAIAVVRKP